MKTLVAARAWVPAVWRQRAVVLDLARRELLTQHRGTYLGSLWTYLHPVTYAVLLYLVFTIGLRTNPGGDVPFVVFLVTGMVAWQFFATQWSALTGVVRAHAFLISKGELSLPVLHLARLLAGLAPHLVLLAATVVINWMAGVPPTWHALQVLYYLAALACLLLGLGWLTSAVVLFVEDVHDLVQLLVQFGFWATPLIWNARNLPPQWRWVIHANPMCYVVDGYRDSLIYHVPVWHRGGETLYFWTVTIAVLWAGAATFRRLRPHFGEVV